VRTVVTAGHVDHGKSTLVRALTGMEPDRLAEERRRGMSIELGFAWCDLSDGRGEPVTVAFVDVPGHERFLPTMLTGAGPAPVALFVVAADQGWQAQSQEHLDALQLLGVPIAVAVVTRGSLASTDRLEEVRADVRHRLAAVNVDVPIVTVDAVEDVGLDDLRAVLLQRLGVLPRPAADGVMRLWLDRVFTMRGAGTVATGTLQGAPIGRGDDVMVVPGGRRARVRTVQSLGRTVTTASPGDRVAVNLAGVDAGEVHRGQALVHEPAPRLTDDVDAVVEVLPGHAVEATGAWRLHVGTAAVQVRVRPTSGRPIAGPASAGLRLRLADSLPLLVGDRFVLRDEGRGMTVAGGSVADPWPGSPPRGAPARRRHEQHLLAIAAAPVPDRLSALLGLAGGAAHVDRVRGLALPASVQPIGDHVVDTTTWESWKRHVVRLLDGAGSVDRMTLVDAITAHGCPPSIVGEVLEKLETGGVVARRGSRFVEPGSQATYDDATRQRRDALVARLAEQPYAPPSIQDAARSVGAGPADVQALLAEKRILRHRDLAFTREAIQSAASTLAELERRGGPFTAGAAREALGTTRKYAIPLLELMDGLGLTSFDGATRRMRR
jgi:selenocysteine-specific elongation factor